MDPERFRQLNCHHQEGLKQQFQFKKIKILLFAIGFLKKCVLFAFLLFELVTEIAVACCLEERTKQFLGLM